LEPIKVSIQQFYGIEINDFAATVAKLRTISFSIRRRDRYVSVRKFPEPQAGSRKVSPDLEPGNTAFRWNALYQH